MIAGKGVDVLLDAAALVTRDIRIRIFGTGPLEEEVRREAAARSLPVELRGYSTKAEIAAELDRSLALVLASVWYENCPMVILEAAGRGVAAIGSDLGGIRELIDHKESGLLVPPGDPRALASALEELADQPDWALQLGRSAWERVRDRHDPAAHIDRVVAIYERVVSGNLTRDALGRAG